MNSKIALSDEILLILESCKENKNEELLKEKLFKIKDWEDFIDLIYSHGVFPLVYNTLKDYKDILSDEIYLKLKSINMDISKQNMLMTSELIKIMNLFEKNCIDAIAFKGPSLSQSAYGNITLRQYCDLDILINKYDIKKAHKILLLENYTNDIKSDYLENSLYLEKNSDIHFIKNGILIELHWKLFRNQFTQKTKNIKILDNNNSTFINNQKINTFPDEILLVYLCMHGSKHLWERIEWIVDIDKLIKNAEFLNWDKCRDISKKFDSEIMYELGLYLSAKYFNTPIPEKNRKFKNNKLMIKLEKYSLKEWDYIHEETETKRNYKKFFYHYYLKDTILLKTSFLFQTFFPLTNGDISVISLPKYMYFLYYIIKPFRLLIKYIRKIVVN